MPEPGKAQRSSVAIVKGGLVHPLGKIQGPIDAGGDSHYYFYFTGNSGGGAMAFLQC